MNTSDVTAITVNFKTPELTYDCLNSFRNFYPDVKHIVIDNGGSEKSIRLFKKMERKGLLTLIENVENVGHGPALNQGIAIVETPYVFLLDSDTKTKQGGFLESMLEKFEQNVKLFACGWLRQVNIKTGVSYRIKGNKTPRGGLPYVHPYACLMDVGKFRQTRQFTNRGAPALETMTDAIAAGFTLEAFPVEEYIWHKVAGTRGLFGGRFAIRTEEEPGPYKRKAI